jgi:hypothetical protein
VDVREGGAPVADAKAPATRQVWIVSDIVVRPGAGVALTCSAGEWDRPLLPGERVTLRRPDGAIRRAKLASVEVFDWSGVRVVRLALTPAVVVGVGTRIWRSGTRPSRGKAARATER